MRETRGIHLETDFKGHESAEEMERMEDHTSPFESLLTQTVEYQGLQSFSLCAAEHSRCLC